RGMAEDLMIKGFLKIFQSVPQYGSMGRFEGWMKKIIVRECLYFLRKHKSLKLELNMDAPESLQAMHFDPGKLEADELMKMIQELPLGYRTVFNLFAIEGYSHAEISDLLGISEGTSKSQLSRARNILKQRLAKQ